MKDFYILALCLGGICSCTEESLDNVSVLQTSQMSAKEKSLVAYPKQMAASSTRSVSQEANWEFWNKVLLASGDSVFTPWNSRYSGTAIPEDIRQDIKAKDGWDLIAHTVNGYGEQGMNYLVFHNKYTGILKVFYNLESYHSNLQNTAIWKIHFEQPQSLLAFSDKIAKLSTDKSDCDIYVSNFTNDETKGYSVGWNCFQTELAYDPDFTGGTMQIIPYNMTTSSVTYDGKIDASTTGVIVTTKTTNPTDGIVKGVANLAGKGAELWVKAKVAKGAFSKISSPLASGAGVLVKKGVSSLLGSFTGAFNSKGETTQSVQLNTEAEVGLVGEIKTLQTGLIKPLSMSIAPFLCWTFRSLVYDRRAKDAAISIYDL